MAATFNIDGSPASVEYQEKTARGETISSAFADAAKGASAGIKNVVSAPTTRLQAQVAALTARNNLITQQTTLTTAEQVGVLQANTNLLKAQGAYDDAQVALQKSQDALAASKK
jgi:hypothetical protein